MLSAAERIFLLPELCQLLPKPRWVTREGDCEEMKTIGRELLAPSWLMFEFVARIGSDPLPLCAGLKIERESSEKPHRLPLE
ncbi:hypothetical protein DM860_007781 [Cuscuta australis]|uniref:Uncharacterized protein n=1 Tax=Cuscuta australis TaxID=267555 RepID=A0A328DWJ5_9ASTE|nr:hypothetical protein DM860_007781 [Cuscuta australis]